MNAKCPHCGASSAQGTNYAKFLELAEANQLKFLCGNCGAPWMPSADDQRIYAVNLRRLITQP